MTPVVAIHGYGYRPGTRHDPGFEFRAWESGLGRPLLWWPWASWPSWWDLLKDNLRRPHRDRCTNSYQLAQLWAEREAERLAGWLARTWPAQPVDLVAHSLGTAVALGAADRLPTALAPRVVLLWAGSAYTATAEAVARHCPRTRFIASTSDDDIVLAEFGHRYGWGTLQTRRKLGREPYAERVIGRAKHAVEAPNWSNVRIGGGHWQYRDYWEEWRAALA